MANSRTDAVRAYVEAMAEEDADTELEIEAMGADGRVHKVGLVLRDGPHSCPTCPGYYSIFEAVGGIEMLAHTDPTCSWFMQAPPEEYLARVHEKECQVNTRDRGSA